MSAFKGILSPTMRFSNSEGKTTFEMKRKDKYGDVYYIFRVYKENFGDEALKEWPAAWTLIRTLATNMGIPLFDYNEITEALNQKFEILAKTPGGRKAQEKANKTGKVVFIKDVEIKVFDHATGEIHTLTIGINAGPVSDELQKESNVT